MKDENRGRQTGVARAAERVGAQRTEKDPAPRLLCRLRVIKAKGGAPRVMPIVSNDFQGRNGRVPAPLLWGDLMARHLAALGVVTGEDDLPDVLRHGCDPARRLAARRAFSAWRRSRGHRRPMGRNGDRS
jgi:hypothetical protein